MTPEELDALTDAAAASWQPGIPTGDHWHAARDADLDAIVTDCERRLGLIPRDASASDAFTTTLAAGSLSPPPPVALTAQGGQSVGNVGVSGAQRSDRLSARAQPSCVVHAISLHCPRGPVGTVHAASGSQSPGLVAYKGIFTTLDALASGIEALVPAGMPAVEPVP